MMAMLMKFWKMAVMAWLDRKKEVMKSFQCEEDLQLHDRCYGGENLKHFEPDSGCEAVYVRFCQYLRLVHYRFAGLSRKAQEGWMRFRPGGIGLDSWTVLVITSFNISSITIFNILEIIYVIIIILR